jgi:ribose-phosphate pyrophosphokinase
LYEFSVKNLYLCSPKAAHGMSSQIKLFGGTASRYLAEEIAQFHDLSLIEAIVQRFSDGEIQPVIQESVRGDFVFFVQSTTAPADNLMELLLLIDAARRASANYITAVIPYFGYARQDRKDKPRVPISAKLIANLLTTAGASRIITMDLHAPQIQGFFDIPVDHLEASAIFIPYIKHSIPRENLIFAAPDVGGTKRARSYAKHFDADMVICDKRRERANEVSEMTVIGDVRGKDVVLIDDIVDTGGTLCKAAQMLMDKGAVSVRALITHPVLSGNAYEKIENSALTELVVCNTIPVKQDCSKIKVLSVSQLFATAIKRAFEYRSISSLFVG